MFSILFRFFKAKSRLLLILEMMTLMVLFGLALAFVRPQLEGWGMFEFFRASGLHDAFLSGSVRILENTPLAIAWILGQGAPWVVGLVYGVELIAKYFIARWAILPLMRGKNGWVVATIAVVMLPWEGQWHAHNMAQQLASVYLLIALGASLRLRQHMHVGWIVLGAASVLLSLLTYEGLVLCALALPLVVLFSSPKSFSYMLRPVLRSAIPVIFGLLLYVLFFLWFQAHSIVKNYHQILVSGPSPFTMPIKLLTYLYRTTYFNSSWVLPFLSILLACLIGSTVCDIPNRKAKIKSIIVLAIALFMLPLFSLIYSENFYFLSDIERVGFPLGFGFTLLCVIALTKFSLSESDSRSFLTGFIVVTVILIGTTINAYSCYRPYMLQQSVIRQISKLLENNIAKTVLVQDWTGRLGDRYTFQYPGTLEQALSVVSQPFQKKLPVGIILCTPASVDRLHPMMEKIAGKSAVSRCEGLPVVESKRLVLDVRETTNPLEPLVKSLGFEDVVDTFVTKGSDTGKDEMAGASLWWINTPQAIIAVENKTKTRKKIVWNGKFILAPCQQKIKIKLTRDGKSFILPIIGSTQYAFTTTVPGNTKKFVYLQVQARGGVCKPELINSRTFYFGIVEMAVNLA